MSSIRVPLEEDLHLFIEENQQKAINNVYNKNMYVFNKKKIDRTLILLWTLEQVIWCLEYKRSYRVRKIRVYR